MSVENQTQQLRLNVTNIHSFLLSKNKEQQKFRRDKINLQKRKISFEKKQQEEKILESVKTSSSSNIAQSVAESSKLGVFDKIFNFGGLLLTGILVNAVDKIVEKGKKFYNNNKQLFDTIGNFLSSVKDAVVGLLDSFTGPESEKGAFDHIGKFDADGKLIRFEKEEEKSLLQKIEEAYDSLGTNLNKIEKAIGGKGTIGNALKKPAQPMGGVGAARRSARGSQYTAPSTSATPVSATSATTTPVSAGNIGNGRGNNPVPVSGGILDGARQIIGMGKGTANECARTTRAALRKAGHPMADIVTQIGDLDTPKGTAYNAPSFAASFGGTDMGQVIKNKSSIKAGDIILWRADRDLGGILNKGGITHVGIAADDGLKHQFDHNERSGFHYRRHWDSSGGTSWFAGIRLGSGRKMQTPSVSTNTQGSGDARSSLSKVLNQSRTTAVNAPDPRSKKRNRRGRIIALQRVNTLVPYTIPVPVSSSSSGSSTPITNPLAWA